jgi:hypothetical protein
MTSPAGLSTNLLPSTSLHRIAFGSPLNPALLRKHNKDVFGRQAADHFREFPRLFKQNEKTFPLLLVGNLKHFRKQFPRTQPKRQLHQPDPILRRECPIP